MGSNSPADLTDRDSAALRLLAEHRVVTATQVAHALAVTERTAWARLRRLQERKLIGLERIFAGQSGAAWIKQPGLSAIGSSLPPSRVELKGYRHDVGVGWVWLAAKGGAFGDLQAVVGEREMRSHDMRAPAGGQPFGVGIVGLDSFGRLARHYPDLLLTTRTGQRVAVELELTAKSARRLDAIMLGYAGDPRIDGVLYLVSTPYLERLISSAAARAGISEIVRVQRVANGHIHGFDRASGGPGRVSPAAARGSDGRGRSARGSDRRERSPRPASGRGAHAKQLDLGR